MSLKDIEKLREKFDRDPNSKLFLPLAEEYRKEGMLDDAINVLQSGLEKHTAYTSARVLLGKIYHEKGMLDDAKKEFESVIKIVPDNLFAHKKLADIYRDTGETELAIKECKAILKLNPMDEDILNNLKEIEAASASTQAQEAESEEHVSEGLSMPETAHIEESEEGHADVNIYSSVEAQDIKVEHSEEELNSFKASLFGDTASAMDDISSEDAAVGADINEGLSVETVELSPNMVDTGLKTVPDNASDIGEINASEEDEISFAEIGEDVETEDIQIIQQAEAAEDSMEDAIELMDSSFDLAEGNIAQGSGEAVSGTVQFPDLAEADRYVGEGRFYDAMNTYRRMLSTDPSNRAILQRVEELRALLKLMGKDKDVLVAKLNSFLEGINKRRDEFLGHS